MVQKKSAKNELKEKKKEVEDKTFGLKNKKKSTKVGKYIQSLEKNMLPKSTAQETKQQAKKAEKKKKEEEFAQLFQVVEEVQKISPGVDPKSVLCINFKKERCSKGAACAFSHDLALENKKARIDFYKDPREERGLLDGDGWRSSQPCPHFIKAVESSEYGWFWICPNGGDACTYVHALPPDYVVGSHLPSEEKKSELSMEEFIEIERKKIGEGGTPVTEESFRTWLKTHPYDFEKRPRKGAKATGRALFDAKPDLFKDDADAEALDIDYKARDWEEENIDGELFRSLEELEIVE